MKNYTLMTDVCCLSVCLTASLSSLIFIGTARFFKIRGVKWGNEWRVDLPQVSFIVLG